MLIAANAPKTPSRSNPALIIRMSCVRGSTTRHTKAQIVTISDSLNAKNRTLLNIALPYPILSCKSRQKYPSLTIVIRRKYQRCSNRQLADSGVVCGLLAPVQLVGWKNEKSKKSVGLLRGCLLHHTCLEYARIATVLILIGDFHKVFVGGLAREGVCKGNIRQVFLDTNIKVIKKGVPNKVFRRLSMKGFLVL